ncbi:FecR domain-containing protein [Rhodocytophaga aerolata]|uniref:FecR domain-containing protein n=1 Tax=Rhodocytophaga aerolata TaxID=455078 RepID=A0ABT8REN8_9BACT|nr:FecR domain-containing protein [Rhodocytophaga aerolata]MDO1449663.1 FecR domain-containing protein [Rhodocytophaga aerolata]
MMSNYTSFQTEDFVLDEYFRSWVAHPTAEKNAFWEHFLSVYPHQRKSVEEARVLVQALQVDWKPVSEQQARQSYQTLEEKLFNSKTTPLWNWKQQAVWYRVAAAITLLLVAFASWLIIQSFNNTTTYQTAYGEIRKITLPDGSTVTINANSKLIYTKEWSSIENREVWLEGEAFFDVKHLKNHQKFLVHTADKFTVEVLGTTFNVFKRESGTRVALQSGKVKLNIGNDNKHTDVIMQPGDLIEVESEKGTYSRKKVNPQLASAWTEHKLIFDNTPLSEVVSILEETYGLQVTISDPALLEKKVFGSCPTEDVDVLLAAISKPFGLSVKRNGKEVFISSP